MPNSESSKTLYALAKLLSYLRTNEKGNVLTNLPENETKMNIPFWYWPRITFVKDAKDPMIDKFVK